MPIHPHSFVAGALLVAVALASPASADWREDMKVLRIGIVADGDAAYRLGTLEPFRVYIQDRVGLPVEIVPAPSYDALIDAQARGDVGYALYSATSYATAVLRCDCVEALAAPIAADGALGFYSVLLARSNDEIASLADAKGKRVALGPADSVSGRLVPLQAFATDGIDPKSYFLSVATYPSPDAAVEALLDGEVDLAAAWSSLTGSAVQGYDFGALTHLVAEGRLDMRQVKIVWQSALIPFGPHAVRFDLPAELKAILSGALLTMATTDPEALDAIDRLGYGGGGFATPDESLYASVIALVKSLGD
jgi:phosphonate transport system substrate-binding protein